MPYLGICLGMQIAVVEFARNVLGLTGANSVEIDPATPHPAVVFMPGEPAALRGWQGCAGRAALAGLRWQGCAGRAALAGLRWQGCAGRAALAGPISTPPPAAHQPTPPLTTT